MEEARKTRRSLLLVALAGAVLLAAIWATMALAGGSTQAAKPAKAPAAKAQSSKAQVSKAQAGPAAGKADGRDCPFEDGRASNDL
jgi:uncharacterized low-complexity protein